MEPPQDDRLHRFGVLVDVTLPAQIAETPNDGRFAIIGIANDQKIGHARTLGLVQEALQGVHDLLSGVIANPAGLIHEL